MSSAIGSIASSFIGNAVGGMAQDKANEFNAEEAAKQRHWSETMWEKSNVYNSPANQKALLKQAGLNPNMLYAQGGAPIPASSPSGSSATSSSFSPGAQASGLDPVSMANAHLMESQAALNEADLKTREDSNIASLQKLLQETDNIKTSTELVSQTILNKQAELDQTKANTKVLEEQANFISKNADKVIAETQSILKENEWIDKNNQAALDNLEANTALTREEKKKVSAEIQKIGADIQLLQLAYKGQELQYSAAKHAYIVKSPDGSIRKMNYYEAQAYLEIQASFYDQTSTDINNQLAQFGLSLEQRYGDAEHAVGIVHGIASAGSSAAKSVVSRGKKR